MPGPGEANIRVLHAIDCCSRRPVQTVSARCEVLLPETFMHPDCETVLDPRREQLAQTMLLNADVEVGRKPRDTFRKDCILVCLSLKRVLRVHAKSFQQR